MWFFGMAPHCRVPSLTHLHAPHFTKTVFPWAQQTEHLSTFNFRVQSKHVTQPLSSATGQTRDTTCFFDYRRNMWRNSILQPQILWLETIGVPMVIFGVPMVIFLNCFFFLLKIYLTRFSTEKLALLKISILTKSLFCWKLDLNRMPFLLKNWNCSVEKKTMNRMTPLLVNWRRRSSSVNQQSKFLFLEALLK